MPNDPPASTPLLYILAGLATIWIVATPAFPANDIYTYVDDDGVPHYTDQWQLIPDRYRSRVQQLDQSTGKPFKPEVVKPVPPQRSLQPPVARTDQAAPPTSAGQPFYTAWLEQFSKLSIPLPSRFQLATGLLITVLLIGAFKIIRASPNPLVKLALKVASMAVLIIGAYAMYLASVNERISNATREPAQRNISGKELLQDIQGATEKAKTIVKEKAQAPLGKVKDATVGDAIRARDAVNQSYREQEKVLNKIESGP